MLREWLEHYAETLTPSVTASAARFLLLLPSLSESRRRRQKCWHAARRPRGEASFDGSGDGNLAVLLAVSLSCSAGQSFSHQFDMRGILLSGEDALFRESRLFSECQGGILSRSPPSLRDPESSVTTIHSLPRGSFSKVTLEGNDITVRCKCLRAGKAGLKMN